MGEGFGGALCQFYRVLVCFSNQLKTGNVLLQQLSALAMQKEVVVRILLVTVTVQYMIQCLKSLMVLLGTTSVAAALGLQ